jgi:hypothetical protein
MGQGHSRCGVKLDHPLGSFGTGFSSNPRVIQTPKAPNTERPQQPNDSPLAPSPFLRLCLCYSRALGTPLPTHWPLPCSLLASSRWPCDRSNSLMF